MFFVNKTFWNGFGLCNKGRCRIIKLWIKWNTFAKRSQDILCVCIVLPIFVILSWKSDHDYATKIFSSKWLLWDYILSVSWRTTCRFFFFKCSLFVVGPHRHKNMHRPTVPIHQPIQGKLENTPRKPLNILKWFLDFSYRSMSVKRGVGYLRSQKPGDCHETLLSCSLINTNNSSCNFQRLRWHVWQFIGLFKGWIRRINRYPMIRAFELYQGDILYKSNNWDLESIYIYI